MKFKTTYIMVAIAVALALFIYIFEIRGGKEREEAKRKETLLFDVQDKDISWVEIQRPNSEPLRVERVGEGDEAVWKIVKPIETRADDGAVGSITWQLAELTYSLVADENPSSLEPFGLVTPELTVKFGTSPKDGVGAEEFTLNFGKKLPIGNESYAQVTGQARVVVIGESARSTFDKQTIDLRDKRVVVFKDENLVGLEIATPELKISFEKSQDDWKITSPLKGDADRDKINKILDDLRFLEAEEFVPSVTLESLKLGTPEMTITLVSGAQQRARQTIRFYRDAAQNKAYAFPEGDVWLYKIPPDIINEVPAPVEEFRRRKVLVFDRWEIEKVVIKPSDGAPDIVLVKNDSGDWKIEAPKEAAKAALASKVYDLFNELENLTAEKFGDSPGDKKTNLKQTVLLYKAVQGKKGEYVEAAVLWLGDTAEEGLRYARGTGSQIVLIKNDLKIPFKPEEFTTEGSSESGSSTPEFDEEDTQ